VTFEEQSNPPRRQQLPTLPRATLQNTRLRWGPLTNVKQRDAENQSLEALRRKEERNVRLHESPLLTLHLLILGSRHLKSLMLMI